MRIYITGLIRIESAGRVLEERHFPARQGRVLLAYLVVNRHRPATRDELAGALWPDRLPVAWETALNALISKLRALLKRAVPPSSLGIRTTSGNYVLHVGDRVWIDREAAAEAIDEAEGFLHANAWREAWAPGNIAAIAARQPFLGGEEGEWIDVERRRLHNILVRALDVLSEVWMRNGEPALALAALREIVALEPYREAAYRRLMSMHVTLGNRAEALRVYDACRVLLAKELGTDPSAETLATYLAIREGGVGSL